MDDEIKTNILSPQIWIRLLIMILFVVCANVALWVLWFVAGLQFLFALITGRPNDNVTEFSAGLLAYLAEIFEFLVFKSEEKPFPFAPFPDGSER